MAYLINCKSLHHVSIIALGSYDARDLSWHCDGKIIAYTFLSDQSGEYTKYSQIHLVDIEKRNIIKICHNGTCNPLWSMDGNKLYYNEIIGNDTNVVSYDLSSNQDNYLIKDQGHYWISGNSSFLDTNNILLAEENKNLRRCICYNLSDQIQISLPFETRHLCLSPDRSNIAFANRQLLNLNYDNIKIYSNIKRDIVYNCPIATGKIIYIIWSSDNKHLYYISQETNEDILYQLELKSGNLSKIYQSKELFAPISMNSEKIAFGIYDENNQINRIVCLDLLRSKNNFISPSDLNVAQPSFSPDGSKLAYVLIKDKKSDIIIDRIKDLNKFWR